MPRKILIIHGEDALKEAVWMQNELEVRGYASWTFASAMEKAPLTGYIIVYHRKLVEESLAVLAIASPRFFKNGFLVELARQAIISKKFTPVLSGHEGTKQAFWFSSFTPIDFNRRDKKLDLEWQRLANILGAK